MSIGSMLKEKVQGLKKREKEIRKELTRLHNLRDTGREIKHEEFNDLHEELKRIRGEIKRLSPLVKGIK